jgi:FAD/FMN-containing dehydrogenase
MEGNAMKKALNETIEKLKGGLNGKVVLPNDPSYDETRKVWNAMINKRPSVIVKCRTAEDIPPAIHFARENGLEISVRGAGHNIAGNAVCDDGLMVDLSGMKNIRVDVRNKRAYVEPGVTLADFDKATQAHGLATPVGINSTTGISGLTLGGGFGWLTRKYGLTIDNLVSVDLITAHGNKIKVSEKNQPDLFWAVRGGGGNFGVAAQFEFNLHPVGPEILAGLIVFPFSEARQVLQHYREFVSSSPLELNIWIVMRDAPPLPFLGAEVHGKRVIVLPVFYSGDIAEGQRLIKPLRSFGNAYGEHIGPMPFVQWQQIFDPLLTPGARNYWKTHSFKELSDGLFDVLIEYAGKLPSPQCEIFIGQLGGVSNNIPVDATAYGPRDARFVANVHGRWIDSTQDEVCIAWARAFFKASACYASTGAYVNFMTEEEGDRVESAYGSNYTRLRQIKKQYDPDNFFHLNQNIKP